MTLYLTAEEAHKHTNGVSYDEIVEIADEFWVMEDHTVVVTHYRDYHGEGKS